jgi:hypothetical protein
MRALAPLLALAALSSLAVPAHADGTVRASCTQGSKNVYREDIPADAPPERRALIATRFPEAMCVFLTKGEELPPIPGTSAPSVLPAEIVAAAAGAASLDDDSLAAALSAITSGREAPEIGSVAAIGEMATLVADRGNGKSPRLPKPAAAPKKNLTLTLGVYKGVGIGEVLAHWRTVQSGRPMLNRMTPTVSSSDGLTVLNVEGVTDGEVAGVCEEAAAGGLSCLAAF